MKGSYYSQEDNELPVWRILECTNEAEGPRIYSCQCLAIK